MIEDPLSLQFPPSMLGTPPLDWVTINAQMERIFDFDVSTLDGQLADGCIPWMDAGLSNTELSST